MPTLQSAIKIFLAVLPENWTRRRKRKNSRKAIAKLTAFHLNTIISQKSYENYLIVFNCSFLGLISKLFFMCSFILYESEAEIYQYNWHQLNNFPPVSVENTCATVSFLINLQASACNFINKRLRYRCFHAKLISEHHWATASSTFPSNQ